MSDQQFSIPPTIPFSSIVWELPHQPRERKTYSGIESLADSIAERGTETPIVLSPLPDGQWLLEAGGRRYTAMRSLGVDTLFYGSVCERGKPGFVVKNRITSTEDHSLTELIENLHRESLDWRDELRLIVRAWRAKKREATLAGAELYYSTFGRMLGGYGHSDINAAIQVHDAVIANPEQFKDCSSIPTAYVKMLKDSKKALEAELATRMMTPVTVTVTEGKSMPNGGEFTYTIDNIAPPPQTVDISSHFKLCDSLLWMEEMIKSGQQFDHIICDPDFAVSQERLEAGVSGAGEGIAQDSIEQSLKVLESFIFLSFQLCNNYLIFWYDLDHHEKLQAIATGAGFRVQRWPIVWHKTDYRSNAAPQHNFCKNIEYAMVCAKPGSTLAQVQMSSVIALPSGSTTKDFSHPFAKPPQLWQKLYSAVATPGQSVYDPFMGSGSSVIAAIRNGLVASGSELNPSHFNSALLNIQKEYQGSLGNNVIFK